MPVDENNNAVDDHSNSQKIPSIYERHPRRCGVVEGASGIVLGVLALFTQPSIAAVVTQGNGNKPSFLNWVLTIATIVLYALYVVFFIKLKYMQYDAIDKRNNEIKRMRSQLNEESSRRHEAEVLKVCSERILWGIATLAKRNAQIANDAVHAIEEKGKSEFSSRSFDDDCRSVCKLLREQLNERYGSDTCFEVSYVARVEQLSELAVKMVAGNATLHGERFTVEGVVRRVSGPNIRYDLKLFKLHDEGKITSESARVLLTAEEVTAEFAKNSVRKTGKGRRQTNQVTKNYTQHIALPVVCPAVEGQTGKKMVGLLQVAVVGSKVWEDEEAAKAMVGDYMVPLGCQLLMIHKLRNSLRAVPKKKDSSA